MEQLGEPILVTSQFIKMIEQSIQPTYEKTLQEVFEQLQKDIDSRYKTKYSILSQDPT